MFLLFSFFSFLFYREISELPRPIDVKLCHVLKRMFNFVIWLSSPTAALSKGYNPGSRNFHCRLSEKL